MKVAVFGATGGTGMQVVEQGLRRGHRITAVVRNPGALARLDAQWLTVVRADVMDPTSVTETIHGHDAVVSALGSRSIGPTTVCTDSSRAILKALAETGIRRLVAVSASGFHTNGDDALTKVLVKPLLGRMLRHPFADLRTMEQQITASDSDWTIVRPPRLTNGRLTGNYRTARGVNVHWGFTVSRADVAHAIYETLDDPSTIRTTLSVAS